MDDRREARAEGGRRFQREGAITAKDMAMVALVRGTKSSRLAMERRGRRDVAEVGSRMASRRYLGATSHLGLENNEHNFIFNASRDWKPMEMFLDVVGDMGVVTLVGMHVKTSLCVRISVRLSNHHSPLNDYRHIILYVICVHNNKHQVCAMCSLFVNALDAQVWTSK